MRYKVLLRNGGSRIFGDFEQLIEMAKEARFSTNLSWTKPEEQIVITFYRDDEIIGVALALKDSYQIDERPQKWSV